MFHGKTAAWRRRIERADQLASENGPAASLLRFYARLLREQQKVCDGLAASPLSGSIEADVDRVSDCMHGILRAILECGPEQLAADARKILNGPGSVSRDLVLTYWRNRSDRMFFPKALLQAYCELVSQQDSATPRTQAAADENTCPNCGGQPQLSILDPSATASAEGSARQLQCATCLVTWPFRRVVCPSCGNEDERTLGYYESPTLPHVRVDTCDRCRRYLKTIDLGRLGLAVPLVDEVAGAPLDVWAGQHGYEKIELNLIGL